MAQKGYRAKSLGYTSRKREEASERRGVELNKEMCDYIKDVREEWVQLTLY
jgi:hypothetical protein